MADINNSGINTNVNSGLSGLSNDVSSSSFSATSTTESFANTPRYSDSKTSPTAESTTASGYQQYLDLGVDYITRGMDAITPVVNRSVESLRPVVSRGVRSARTQVEANPWIGVGVAAGVSMFVGYLLGRSLAPTRSGSSYADYSVGMSNTVGSTTESTTTPNVGVDIRNSDDIDLI